MDEQKIRQIARQEAEKILTTNSYSGAPVVPRHTHDGVNSPKINQINLIPSTEINGTINMTQGTISGSYPNQVINWANYFIPIPSTLNSVSFYGGALNTTASPAMHAMIVGQAKLVSGYQYQPGTSNSVVAGTIKEAIIQGSAAFIMTNGQGGTGAGAFAIIRNSQSYIAFASDASNNIYAVARVASYDSSQLIVQTAFASNWSLSGLWTIN